MPVPFLGRSKSRHPGRTSGRDLAVLGTLLAIGTWGLGCQGAVRPRPAASDAGAPIGGMQSPPAQADARVTPGPDGAVPPPVDSRPPLPVDVAVDRAVDTTRPVADAGAGMDVPAALDSGARLLIQSPVAADAGAPRCMMAGITNVAQFEQIFLQETGVPDAQKRRGCANRMCHGGNYSPDFRGTGVGVRIATTLKSTYHCSDLGMRVIDVDRPDRSMFLWRLFLTEKAVDCSSTDDYMMRRMPIIIGMQDSGGQAPSVGIRLNAQELDCARWYVHEIARMVKGM